MSTLDNFFNALTEKARTANRDITREIVEDWVGDDGYIDRQIAFMSVVLTDLQKGEYSAEEMVGDILHLRYLDN